jgi:hypothetical protein
MLQENEFCGSWVFRYPYRPLINPAPYLYWMVTKKGAQICPHSLA